MDVKRNVEKGCGRRGRRQLELQDDLSRWGVGVGPRRWLQSWLLRTGDRSRSGSGGARAVLRSQHVRMRNGCENYNQSPAFARVRGCCERGTVRGPVPAERERSSARSMCEYGIDVRITTRPQRLCVFEAAANGGPFAVRKKRACTKCHRRSELIREPTSFSPEWSSTQSGRTRADRW